MKLILHALAPLVFFVAMPLVRADDFAARCADRAAIERVYHAHRLGVNQPFEQVMPASLIGELVRQDQRKAEKLRTAYGVVITPEMLATEVERITTTTRAPEILAEIRRALGDDAARFTASMARPIVVERELRRRFDGDVTLHAEQRRSAEHARQRLLAQQPVKEMHEVTWQMAPRPADRRPAAAAAPIGPTQGSSKSSAYSNEATARVAQSLTHKHLSARGWKQYFEDLEPEVQSALQRDLQKPGDVSSVIERPGGFVVFLAKAKTQETLTTASFSVSKRDYDAWVATQTVPQN